KAFTLDSGGAMDYQQAPATATGLGPTTNRNTSYAFFTDGKQPTVSISNQNLLNLGYCQSGNSQYRIASFLYPPFLGARAK
ncbi:MAG: hypothetical protein Q8N14_05455, partial [Candidatus Omnitrophota bacterium]|nr:hypothetical protein [Candidatus Omnitrophota bacterium]